MNELEEIIWKDSIKTFNGEEYLAKQYAQHRVDSFRHFSQYPVGHYLREDYDLIINKYKKGWIE